MKAIKDLLKWIRTPNRRWIDFPPSIAGTVLVAYWWVCWGWTGDIFSGGKVVLLTIAGALLWVVGVKVWDRRAELIGEGNDVPWWRLPFNFITSGRKFGDVDTRWTTYTSAQKVAWNGVEPKLLRKRLTPTGDVRGYVTPGSIGGDIARIAADAVTVLPGIMGCTEVSLTPVGKGAGWLTFWKTSPLDKARSVLDLPPSGYDSLTFGWQNDGTPATVPYGYNLLVGAASGAGKSKFTWNLWFDLVRDETPTDVHILDPKGELKWFKDWVGRSFGHGHIRIVSYMKTLAEGEEHFAQLRETLHERQDALPAGEDLETPTDEFPGVLTIIDEGLDVAPLFAKGMAATDMGVYMSQGRSTKDFVWMSVQVATVQEIGGIRKAFQFRASLRQTSAEDTKAVLGIDESKGVPCSLIPFNMRGVGFYVTEEGERMKFRTADVGKVHVRHLMTTGELPENMMTRDLARELRNGQRPHYGYRAFGWLPNGRPFHLYSGETNKRERRYGEHRRDDVWTGWCKFPGCSNVDCRWWANHVAYTESGVFAGKEAAKAWESKEIHALQPPFNIAGAGNNHVFQLTRLTYRGPKFERDGEVVPRPPKPPRKPPTVVQKTRAPKPPRDRKTHEPAHVVQGDVVTAPNPYRPHGYVPRQRPLIVHEATRPGRNDHLTSIPGFGASE
jgi:hypothetical protein